MNSVWDRILCTRGLDRSRACVGIGMAKPFLQVAVLGELLLPLPRGSVILLSVRIREARFVFLQHIREWSGLSHRMGWCHDGV